MIYRPFKTDADTDSRLWNMDKIKDFQTDQGRFAGNPIHVGLIILVILCPRYDYKRGWNFVNLFTKCLTRHSKQHDFMIYRPLINLPKCHFLAHYPKTLTHKTPIFYTSIPCNNLLAILKSSLSSIHIKVTQNQWKYVCNMYISTVHYTDCKCGCIS